MNTNKRYSPEVRERAVRLVVEQQGEYSSRWAAISSIAEKIGCTAETLRRWVRQRIQRLHAQWKKALRESTHAESQHRARILAKRLRYNIEALCPLLPARTQRWLQQASGVQAGIGASRDLLQAGVLAQRLAVDRGIVAFLRGYAAGRAGVPWASQLPGSV